MPFAEIWNNPVQAGFAAFAGVLVGILFWVIRELFKIIRNDLRHVKDVVDHLPCRDEDCPDGCREETS